MSTTYEMTYEIPVALLSRATTSWAQPQRTRRQKILRAALPIVAGAVIGLALLFTGVFALFPDHMLTGMLIGFYIGLVFMLAAYSWNKRRLSRLMAQQTAKLGPVTTRFSDRGVETESNLGTAFSRWHGYDQVIWIEGATVLRIGGVVYPFPHAALPEGVDAATFHADVIRWQEAAQ